MKAASAPAITFICTTLMPDVLAPASLQRAALRARPVVDLRKLTMKRAMITKTTRQRYAYARSEAAKPGRLMVSPRPWFTKLGRVKTRFSMRSPNVRVTRAT